MNKIQKRFEEASRYDVMMTQVFPGYEQLPLILLSHLRIYLGAVARVLDAGCGTASALATFATNQRDWSFVGVDPAEPMLDLARTRINGAEVAERVTLVLGTVDTLPNEPAFDAATAILVEHLLPDDGAKLRFFEGIWRRLLPGGWIILAGLHGDLESGPAQRALQAWLEFISLQNLPPEVQEMVRRRATVEDSLVSEARLLQLLTEAGFVNIDRIYQIYLLGAWAAQKQQEI